MNPPPPSSSAPAQPAAANQTPQAQPSTENPHTRGRLGAARDAMSAVLGAVMGLLPHLLHHVGLIAGTALVTGAGGNAIFFVVGLLFSLPMLRRLYRRFHTWAAPAIAVALYVALFALSAFVIGPAITGSPDTPPAPATPSQTTPADHNQHHTP